MTFQKKIALWLLGAALLLLVLYFAVLSPLLQGLEQTDEKEPLELLPGEGYYQNGNTVFTDRGVIYPSMGYKDIFRVVVHNTDGEEYLFFHYVANKSDYFAMGQYVSGTHEEGGEISYYYPSITDNFAGFDYTTLYDGQGEIPAMLAAVGNVLFSERVYIKPEGIAPLDYQAALHRYGLAGEDNAPWIEITPFMRDDDGNLMYTATTADGGEGELYCYNPKDKKYYHTDGVDKQNGVYVYDAAYVYTGDVSLLTPAADLLNPQRLYVGRDLPSGDGYYVKLSGRDVVYVVGSVKSELADIDLANLVERDLSYYIEPNLMVPPVNNYDPFLTPYTGMYTGTQKADGQPIAAGDTVYFLKADGSWQQHTVSMEKGDILSLVLLSRTAGQTNLGLPTMPLAVFLGEDGQVNYRITHIHSVLNAPYTAWSDENIREGAVLRVSFQTEEGVLREGFLSLAGEGLTGEQKQAFLGRPTGPCDDLSFTVTYTPSLYLSLLSAWREGMPLLGEDIIREGDTVSISYYESDPQQAIVASVTLHLQSTDGFIAALSRLLIGQKPGQVGQNIGFAKDECFVGEETGDIFQTICYEEDLSFSFYYYGTGKRDPYLADSIYQITGPDSLTSYAIDSGTAQKVLEVFHTLKGNETVAVGLTPQLMEEYGLFARRLDYSMTYNTKMQQDTQGNVTSMSQEFRMDYVFYVSDEKDGYRYVASQEYDIVVKMQADTLAFLDWDFLTRYARSNLLLMYTSNIKQIEFISNFTDQKSHHTFWLSLDPAFKYESKGETSLVERLYVMYVEGEAQTSYPEIMTGVSARPGVLVEQLSDTEQRVTKLIGGTNLDDIYKNAGHTERDRVDFMGVHYFRRMMTALYSTRYIGQASGDLSQGEIDLLLENPTARVMEIKVTLLDGRTYSYAFYAYSAERMLVSLTGRSEQGDVIARSCLFYVNGSEIKKINTFCNRLTMGVPLHEDEDY